MQQESFEKKVQKYNFFPLDRNIVFDIIKTVLYLAISFVFWDLMCTISDCLNNGKHEVEILDNKP